ncbi:MAG: DUF2141 domain-containing protein [Fibrobacter sp.]|nr:DUF2141 domain-containing protein [Fibrobacter sp.]
MNRKSLISIIIASILLLISVTNASDQGVSLTVIAENLRNSKGVVQIALYNKDGTIPDEHYKNHFKMKKVAIANGEAQYTFTNLPKGVYAVNILHDENNNGKIDKGMILPKEGIGFSNYSSLGLTNRPNYKKASFELKENTTIKVKVIYM